jgi:hypothetical protein
LPLEYSEGCKLPVAFAEAAPFEAVASLKLKTSDHFRSKFPLRSNLNQHFLRMKRRYLISTNLIYRKWDYKSHGSFKTGLKIPPSKGSGTFLARMGSVWQV